TVSLPASGSKSSSCDHSTVYGVAARPTPVSDGSFQVQVGVMSVVGVIVVGSSGASGAVISTITDPAGDQPDEFPTASVARTQTYHIPWASPVICVKLASDTLLLPVAEPQSLAAAVAQRIVYG